MQGSELVKKVAAAHKPQLERLSGRQIHDSEAETIVAAVVAAFFEEVTAALAAGRAVVLRRFGRFETHRRKPRTIRPGGLRPAVDVPARATVGFAPSDSLKSLVRNSTKEQGSADVQHHPPADPQG